MTDNAIKELREMVINGCMMEVIEASHILLTALEAAEKREEELAEALQNIKKHQEIIMPSGVELSATWNIAKNALAGEE